uniref:Uncharacterized protein n=1 Tax=Moniliophthora roreri TaxID=221103 RepID=A0A0W0G175_MONRR
MHLARQKQKRNRGVATSLYLYPTIILYFVTTLVIIGNVMQRSIRAVLIFDAVKTQQYNAIKNYLQHDSRKTVSFVFITMGQVVLKYDYFSILVYPETSQLTLSHEASSQITSSNGTRSTVQIHRCYLIWGSKKRIAAPLIVASVVTNVIGIIGSMMYSIGIHDTRKGHHHNVQIANLGDYLQTIFLIMCVVVNSILTLVTAGRIWWMYRQSQNCENKNMLRRVIRIVVESGLIYPIFTLIHVATVNSVAWRKLPFEFRATAVQAAGIAPTLIVIRAQLGKTVETTIHSCEVQGEVLSEFRVTSCPPHSEGFTDSIHPDLEKRSQIHALEMKPFSPSRGESSAAGSIKDKDSGFKEDVTVV